MILVALLISSKFDIVKKTLDTLLTQHRFDDYRIVVFINTLNESFAQEASDYFASNKHRLIHNVVRTESNGRPGKGYNSLYDYFKSSPEYEYLLTMDGDDFLYPESLYRINALISEHSRPDMINLAGNTKFKCVSDVNVQNTSYSVTCKYIFDESRVTNFSKDYNTALATPSRALIIGRRITELYDSVHDDDMYVFSDYKTFLISYKEYLRGVLKILYVSDPYMYLWNGINNSSTSGAGNYIKANEQFDMARIGQIKTDLEISSLKMEAVPILYNNHPMDETLISKFYVDIITNSAIFRPSNGEVISRLMASK